MELPRKPLPTRVDQTPDLPPAYEAALGRGLDDLGLDLSRDARAAIDGHARLLLAWTEAINLTAIREPGVVALAHVVDSLSAVPLLRERAIDRFVDIGSGGGYPGLPLAAALPAARALLAEPIGKKAGFLGTVIAAVGLGGIAEAAAVRAEVLASDARHRGRWPAVTARAVARMADLVELGLPAPRAGRHPDRLEARRSGRGTRRRPSAPWTPSAVGDWTCARFTSRASMITGSSWPPSVAGSRPTYPRDPGTRKRRPW